MTGIAVKTEAGKPLTWRRGTVCFFNTETKDGARGIMRKPTDVLNSLSSKSKDTQYKYRRLYRNLYNPEFYLLAYKNIYANDGSTTPGMDGTSLDGMSLKRIDRIIQSLRNHSYRPNPARRTYIAKKSNPAKKRPLGIPSGDDKLLQEVVRMILESIYEPTFSDTSHGFRPYRSCHTALDKIQRTFSGAKWFLEGDIQACFDSFNHQVLVNILRKRIEDEAFLELMWKFLKSGYMEQWTYHKTYSGTPQGSGISPILANIYMNELDEHMATYKEKFNSSKRSRNLEYGRICNTIHSYKAKCAKSWDKMDKKSRKECANELRKMKSKQLTTPVRPFQETGYKMVQYVRYADDFIVGIIGSKEDAQALKQNLTIFLRETLCLTLSEEKTKITHTSKAARFLGYDITVARDQNTKWTRNGKRVRVYNGSVQLRVPHEKWKQKLLEYKAIRISKDKSGKERWKAIHRGKLVNLTDIDILDRYNAEIRGYYNYYSMAGNVSTLNQFSGLMKYSMLKTFGAKYKCQTSTIKERYAKNGMFTVQYMTKKGPKERMFYNGGFRKQRNPCTGQVDVLDIYKKYDKPNSLAARLKAKQCELCGEKCAELVMYQVKRLKDLSGQTEWELLMRSRHRKTLAVCPSCHAEIHNSMKL